MSRTIAGAVALAVVLQGWLGWPLALRMAEQAAAGVVPTIVLCTAAGVEHATPGHGDPDGPPAPGHEHRTCLICHGALAPLLLLAAGPPPPPGLAAAPHDATWPDRLAPQSDIAAYAPRAPPLNA